MKYGDITIMPSGLRVKHVKKSHTIAYPRRDEADSHYLGRGPTVISCTITVVSFADLVALQTMALSHTEATLYVDKTAPDSHYYTRVVLELGDEEKLGTAEVWRVPAVFTALNPRLYSAATHEVVY
jgi:hypothetical protein